MVDDSGQAHDHHIRQECEQVAGKQHRGRVQDAIVPVR
jgi:hypothetical protein